VEPETPLIRDAIEDYSGSNDFQVGDLVTYHGSLSEYHGDIFEITKLFDYNGIPCATLSSNTLHWWVARCRVTNLKPIIRVTGETECNESQNSDTSQH